VEHVGVRPIRPGEVNEGATVAARALHNDPFFRYLCADPVKRATALPVFWRASLTGSASAGETLVAVDGTQVVGVGSWVPPGRYPLPATAQARQMIGALRGMIRAPRRLPEAVKTLARIDKLHPKEPLWYLALLSVDPSRQRQGIGERLVEPILERSDGEGIDAYLETSNEVNLAYYGRFGFEVVEEVHPGRTSPPLWTLRRTAR
jgi:ribosomal protein S18 acetylase RimI-like enzyme